jgi:hypothetical protein
MGGRALPLALAGAYLALALAWAVSSAPFTAPDERAHYLRALGVSGGSLVGPKAVYDDPTQTPETRVWIRQLGRAVDVPRGLSPDGWDCPVLRPVSAACQPDGPGGGGREVTPVGTYQPAPYLLPAAVVRVGGDAGEADRFGRIALALAWGALIGAAALALWAGATSLLGLIVAVTPMAVFAGASLSGSGLEIAAAIAFAAALLRLTRDEERPGWVWWLAGIAGVVLALSRTVGPLWVLAAAIAAPAISPRREPGRPASGHEADRPATGGPGPLWRTRAAIVAGVAIVAAIVANRVWEARYGPHADVGLSPLRDSLGTGWRQLDGVLLQSVGKFGALQVDLPAFAYVVWGLMAAGLVALAVRAGRRRERVVLAVALAGAAVFPVLFYAAVARHAGIPLQGRHVLPLFAIVALLAGEIAHRGRARRSEPAVVADPDPPAPDRWLLAGFLLAAAAIQVIAWWENSRRWADGPDGPVWFLRSPAWSPPAGWVPWLALVVLGAATLAAAPWLTRASSRRR